MSLQWGDSAEPIADSPAVRICLPEDGTMEVRTFEGREPVDATILADLTKMVRRELGGGGLLEMQPLDRFPSDFVCRWVTRMLGDAIGRAVDRGVIVRREEGWVYAERKKA